MILDSEAPVVDIESTQVEISQLVDKYDAACGAFESLRNGVSDVLNTRRHTAMFDARSRLMNEMVKMNSTQIESLWKMVESRSARFLTSVGAMICEVALMSAIDRLGVKSRLASPAEDAKGIDIVINEGQTAWNIQVKNNAGLDARNMKVQRLDGIVLVTFPAFEKMVRENGGVGNLWISHEMTSPIKQAAEKVIQIVG